MRNQIDELKEAIAAVAELGHALEKIAAMLEEEDDPAEAGQKIPLLAGPTAGDARAQAGWIRLAEACMWEKLERMETA